MRVTILMAGCLLLAGCGSGGGSSTNSAATPLGSGGSLPTPSPMPSPAPTPVPAPTPAPSYLKYSELTGNQILQTACASVPLAPTGSTLLFQAQGFGSGPPLNYTSSTQSYLINEYGFNSTFGPSDIDPAAPGPNYYRKTVGTTTETFSIIQSTSGGTAFDYVRHYSLTGLVGTQLQRNYCVFGVPTVATDVPTGTNLTFSKVVISGIAYIKRPSGAIESYSLSGSTATLAFNMTNGNVLSNLALSGTRLIAGSTAVVPFGNFRTIQAFDIEPAQSKFAGRMEGTDRVATNSYYGGSFFGPQGAEAAYAFGLTTSDPATSAQIVVIGTVRATR